MVNRCPLCGRLRKKGRKYWVCDNCRKSEPVEESMDKFLG